MANKKIPETLSWVAESHVQPQRSPIWYLGFALVSLGLIAYAFYTHSWLPGLTFLLIIFAIVIFSVQPSHEVTYQITRTGIVAGNTIYPFKIIKKFWIIYNPPEVKTLNLKTSAYLNNRISIQLGHQDPMEVKLILRQYLLQDLNMEESLTEVLARRLKI